MIELIGIHIIGLVQFPLIDPTSDERMNEYR